MIKIILSLFLTLILSSCSGGGDDNSLYLPVLSVTCKSSEVNTCNTSNSSRYVYMGLKPRYDGFSCNDVYQMYPSNFNSYFEYHIEFQVFNNSKGLFAQGMDWFDQKSQVSSSVTADKEYVLCGFIDFNSDRMLSALEPIYNDNFEFNFDPYTVDEWTKNQ